MNDAIGIEDALINKMEYPSLTVPLGVTSIKAERLQRGRRHHQVPHLFFTALYLKHVSKDLSRG